MVCSAELGTEAEIGHLRQLRDYHAAGIIFAGSGRYADPAAADLADAVAETRERGSSVVALAQRDFDAPRIVFDNEAAAHDITAYVRSLGHERITFVEGPPASTRARSGARASSARAARDRVVGGFAYEDGVRAAEKLLARGRCRTRSSPPTTRPRSAC